jgi:CDP-diglyceride synthetase
MTAVLLIGGVVCVLVGAAFFWLNNNSPIQTRIPLYTLPIGFVAVLLGLGKLIA